MGSGQPECVPARQKDIACHLDNPRLMRAFPQSPNPHNGNAVFYDRSVNRSDPSGKHHYAMTPFNEGPRDLLTGCSRSPADRRIFVVDKEVVSHGGSARAYGRVGVWAWRRTEVTAFAFRAYRFRANMLLRRYADTPLRPYVFYRRGERSSIQIHQRAARSSC